MRYGYTATYETSSLSFVLLQRMVSAWTLSSVKSNYHGQISSSNYASYNCVQVNKPPSRYPVKEEMISWLQIQGVTCHCTMMKH
jgi:hypothetical protein